MDLEAEVLVAIEHLIITKLLEVVLLQKLQLNLYQEQHIQ